MAKKRLCVRDTGGVSDLGRWDPLTPQQVVDLFWASPVRPSWWIAGGYAIELFVGRSLRQHADIDVMILRRDQQLVHDVLSGWDIRAADPPGHLRSWRARETLPHSVHDIWCREDPSGPWRLQVMLDESDGERWYSRRKSTIAMPIRDLGRHTSDGWPYLSPEVQLFYKAKALDQLEKDEMDSRTRHS